MNVSLSASEIGSITGLNMEKLRVWRHRGYPLPKARAVFSFQDAVVFACLSKMLDHGFPPAEAADMLSRLDVWRTVAIDQEYEDTQTAIDEALKGRDDARQDLDAIRLDVDDQFIGFVVETQDDGSKRLGYLESSRPEEFFAGMTSAQVVTVINVTAIRREVAAKIKARA